MKTAILSNVNIDPLRQLLEADFDIFQNDGFGNLLESLLNPHSAFHAYGPDVVFLLCDISLLTQGCASRAEYEAAVSNWFAALAPCLSPQKNYFIADADFRTREAGIAPADEDMAQVCEAYFDGQLAALAAKSPNVHLFPYKKTACAIGKQAFYSSRLWYLGKIVHAPAGLRALAGAIKDSLRLLSAVPKKVLLLDLDDTLWGGVVGEAGTDGVALSEEGVGLCYKDAQRILKKIKNTGAVLGVVSKNNEADALDCIRNNPHMLLRADDFAAMRINWEPKHENIAAIAAELNVGLDSVVFVDDSATEREIVRAFLPMVEVPDFPAQPEQLPDFYADLYETYFKKLSLTAEDKIKTRQYQENARRVQLQQSAADFPSFLRGLGLELSVIIPGETHLERLSQLVQKTNQFNLANRRHDRAALAAMVADPAFLCRLFSLRDKFGEYGVVGAVIVDTRPDVPEIDTFVLSCRAMGRLVEAAMLDTVEAALAEKGFARLDGVLVKTPKNIPAQPFYGSMGYAPVSGAEGGQRLRVVLSDRPKREYYLDYSPKEG